MKELKVFLKYPLQISDSQYYVSITSNPPKKINYINSIRRAGMLRNKRNRVFLDKLKRGVKLFLKKTSFPIPVAYYIKNAKNYDLIHCAHCLCLNKKPWVADVEFPSQMWGGVILTEMRKKVINKILRSKNCKKIMPWTEATKKGILKEFPEVKDKVEVISYGMEAPKFKKIKSKKVRLLFTSRYFFAKGGLHALEVIDRLTKKHKNVEATFISEVPKEILDKYSSNKKIRFFGPVPFEKILKEIYPTSDIYVYPGYSDSFGFPFIEAQAFGIPVVTVDGYSRKELISQGITGFLIKRPKKLSVNDVETNEKTIRELVQKTELLIKNKKLLKKMSVAGMEEVKNGKFSLKERNKKLRKIYEDSLK